MSHDKKDEEKLPLPAEVWVVCLQHDHGTMSADFVASHRHMAMEHAADFDPEYAQEFGPVKVGRYVLAEEGSQRTAAADHAELDVPLALPADQKKRIGRAIADEMAKNWQCDDDVIDSFGRVAAVAYVLGMRPGPLSAAADSTPAWVAAEKAKADAYEAAAVICEEMGYPPEGRAAWRSNSPEEWAAIKLEDAAKAIRERKAKVCQVTQASGVASHVAHSTLLPIDPRRPESVMSEGEKKLCDELAQGKCSRCGSSAADYLRIGCNAIPCPMKGTAASREGAGTK